MSIFLKPGVLKVRDENEDFSPINIMAEESSQNYLAAIQNKGEEVMDAIEEKGEDTIDSIPSDYTALTNEVEGLKEDLNSILVQESPTGSVTLTNIENITSFYTGVTSGSTPGIKKTSNVDGVATFTAYGGSQLSPYVRHTGSWGSNKWICGFKYRLTKLDQNLGNPEKIRIYLGASQYYDSAIVWDQWVDFAEVITTDLTRISIIIANFAVAPSADSFKVEIKDVYLYDATDVSSELCALVMSQQSENYQDGTVTYGDTDANYKPDKSLSHEGKAADAKAVGDAIGVPTYNVQKYGVKGDGVTDDTNAIQSLFSSKNGIFYFPSGTYKISGTLSIPESSEMCGDGDTTVISVYNYTNLDYRIFRNNTRVYPYILVENPYTYLHDFKIVGSTPEHRTHYGIGVIDTHHCDIKNITAYNINYDPTRQDSDTEYASAYGITSLRSDYVTIENCNVSLCGYECIGVSDDCNHSVVRDCYTQDGWRTCIQVHRGAVNTLIDNCYMKQTHEKYHACFTVHGIDGYEVENLIVTNCTMECVVNGAQPNTENAPAQMMSYISNLVFMANRIFGGKRAFYITSDSTKAKIIGNDLHCNDQSDYGVYIKSLLSIVVGNCLVNEANDQVNVITNNPVLLGNIGIS